jgi:murein DD-endopeptidase MepM/ murein hydrolase activator NlpD
MNADGPLRRKAENAAGSSESEREVERRRFSIRNRTYLAATDLRPGLDSPRHATWLAIDSLFGAYRPAFPKLWTIAEMDFGRVERLAQRILGLFPERHLYVRSGKDVRGFVLTRGHQLTLTAIILAGAGWMTISTVGMLYEAVSRARAEAEVAQTQAKYERWIADREARLDSALAQLNGPANSVVDLANTLEKRHAALALLLTQARDAPGAVAALVPVLAHPAAVAGIAPAQRIQAIQADQEKVIEAAGSFARNRADRLRLAFRLAGLDPNVYAGRGGALGGPLIEAKDPRALAAVLDVDEDFAKRIQSAATDLSDLRGLSDATEALPLAHPTENTTESSGFGVRLDPFTGQPAFHSGQDFAGAFLSPVTATAPGVVSFTGVRSGYGNTVEIDHGRGFKTRYAHLETIFVTAGQTVALGQKLGAMGSTGRSTGTHLHYEVWVNGRAQNPMRFVKAGDYVQQTQ